MYLFLPRQPVGTNIDMQFLFFPPPPLPRRLWPNLRFHYRCEGDSRRHLGDGRQ